MKKLFCNKLILSVVIIALILIGLGVASIFSAGKSGPVSDFINILISPVQKGLSLAGDNLGNVVGNFTNYSDMVKENKKLQDKVSDLEKKVQKYKMYEQENQELRDMLNLTKARSDLTLEKAEIIGRTDSQWSSVLTIDKGSTAKIAMYDAVITSQGFVGYISSISPTSAEVTALTDTTMSCGAILARTRQTGVAEGNFALMKKGELRLSLLPKDAEVSIGDTVETSGLGGLFPKGILIGTVEDVLMEKEGVSKYAILKPVVDTNTITTVFIVLHFDVAS